MKSESSDTRSGAASRPREEQAPAAVVLLSGGMDSATVLALAVHRGYRCHALSVAYGQRHAVELEAARDIAAHLGACEHRVVDLDLGFLGSSALLDRNIAVPENPAAPVAPVVPAVLVTPVAQVVPTTPVASAAPVTLVAPTAPIVPTAPAAPVVPAAPLASAAPAVSAAHDATNEAQQSRARKAGEEAHNIPVTYVPARNTILLSLALAWAEALPAQHIFLGVNAVDYSGYPDCRPDYLAAWQGMADLATRAALEGRGIRLHTPLVAYSKAQIIRQGAELGVEYERTVSCYQPDATGAACGRCDSCHIRRAGFAALGLPDATRYM